MSQTTANQPAPVLEPGGQHRAPDGADAPPGPYCPSRFRAIRRSTLEVMVGEVGVGGANPVRLQSMTTSDTQDVAATVRQSIALAEAGCEIVRVTAPNVAAAKCLREIRAGFTAAGFGRVPLVADIHFLPSAAMEAVEWVEKVRVNPGNYADKKRFAVREYSDLDYERELQRLHEAFSPLVRRARELGRALRIGTNHGSLSDRIMNRHGDTPLGMVESALEFLRIAESHGYRQTILSMKASNPKIMIQAYRLLVERMDREGMRYPLHLGVTEAGDGEDGRIKSAIGIGSLLLDGLGDTIRVSLTEDSVYEIPVARALADLATSGWQNGDGRPAASETDGIDPYHFNRRETRALALGEHVLTGPEQPPRVIVRATSIATLAATLRELAASRFLETPAEGVLVKIDSLAALGEAEAVFGAQPASGPFAVYALTGIGLDELRSAAIRLRPGTVLLRPIAAGDGLALAAWLRFVRDNRLVLAADLNPTEFSGLEAAWREAGDESLIVTLSHPDRSTGHALGAYRRLAQRLREAGVRTPLWIRNTAGTALRGDPSYLAKLLEAAMLTGGLLCDGLGDLVSLETEADPGRATKLAYNVLQGAGARSSKTEFVACPSCGRTLFDLQATTQRIRARTGHLKGVKIAIMGCIVNGPGEMADADFGYVGGAPGKINLYAGRQCVQYNLPQAEADDRLVALIREHGKWAEPRGDTGS